MNRKLLAALVIINVIFSMYSIYGNSNVESTNLTGWSQSSHSNDVEPNYDIVFNQNEVLELNIVISKENWNSMQEDLETNVEVQGRGMKADFMSDRPEGDRPEGDRPEGDRPEGDRPEGDRPEGDRPEGDRPPPLDGPQVGLNQNQAKNITNSTSSFDPIWVESNIVFNNTIWEHVGIRFKGNSSLNSTYSSGNGKLSLKLSFDKFEDEYTDIDNQRFYGFKQLNLNNNFSDQSFLREKVTSDLFREFGLVSAETSFCAVYVDYGEGREYFGLYTIVEEMDDTVINTQLGDDSGNLYKPDGQAASFANGTYNEEIMSKKSNEDEGDYTDVLSLYETLNSALRLDDYDTWKADLENILNVDGFLKWLAANSIIQNWDTYGNSTRNYYLYNDPATNLLNWIPWDNNEALQSGKGANYDLSYSTIKDNWPLIKYLLQDTKYKEIYNGYLERFIQDIFIEDTMIDQYNKYYELLKPYAYAEEPGYTFLRSEDSFDSAIENLKKHVVNRNEYVMSYLKNNN